MLMGVFLLLFRMLWDRCIATSSRHNWQSALDPFTTSLLTSPTHPMVFMNNSLRKLSACE